MIENANLIVATLSAMGTLVQAYASITSPDKQKVRASKKRASKKLSRGGKKVAEVIDPNLLECFSVKIQKEYIELYNVLASDSSSLPEQKVAISRANKNICFYLTNIKEHNKGSLPTKRLKKLCQSHNCK